MFLATTAIEEFWDHNDEIYLLGQWCDVNKINSYKKMSYLWNHHEKIAKGLSRCSIYYEFFLEVLTKELNSIHKINQTKHYYRILLGSWLYYYISINFDRIISIYIFYKKYGKFNTYLLDIAQYYIPFDFEDYRNAVLDDRYNLQVYSSIINYLFPDGKFIQKSLNNPLKVKDYKVYPKVSFIKKMINFVTRVLSKFVKNKILISQPFFGNNAILYMLKLFIKSKCSIIYDDMQYVKKIKIKHDRRLRFQINNQSTNLFKKYIYENILKDIPSIYLENYNDFKFVTLNKFNIIPDIFYTSVSLFSNNEVKFFLAEYYSLIKIISHQHGGSYGIVPNVVSEDNERLIADYFFTAGWKEDNKTIPMGLPFLYKSINKSLGNNIVYVTTGAPIYFFRFTYYPMSSNYLNEFERDMGQFFNIIDPLILKKNFVIRPYNSKYSHMMVDRVIKKFDLKEIVSQDKQSSITQIINNSRLLVFDHMGTVILETLFLNKPTIIFIDFDIYRFRGHFLDTLKSLIDVKILHSSPVSAAKHINCINNNINMWWNSNEVQNARKLFVDKFANSNARWDDNLIKAFNMILEGKELS